MKFPKLFQRVVLRSIKEERFLTALSVLGVALGIGLYLGVNVATDRAVSSFSANISSLNPASTYEVLDSSGLDFPDVVYQRVRGIAGESLPILTAHAFIPSAKETVTINGIYTVKTFLFSDRAERNTVPLKDFLQDLSGVVVTRPFAQKHQLKQGSVFNAYVYTKEYPLKVAGVIDDPSVPSNEAFMDLGNFQEYFGKTGLLSRIDVKADEKEAEEIGRALPSGVMIERKQVILQHRKGLIDAFQFNLRFVTFLAVLVGVFLLYNTIFISVVKRRKEIGILRGLGMGKMTVLSLFLGQGLLLGIAGSAVGILLGRFASSFSFGPVEKTVSQFFGSSAVPNSSLTTGDAAFAAGLGLAVSFIASLLPALEAARTRPNESLREGTFEQAGRSRERFSCCTGLSAVIAAAALVCVDYRYVPFRFPWLSYGAIVLFILGATLCGPAYLGASLKALKQPLSRCFKAGAVIAVGDTSGSRRRFSFAVMSVAVSSALIVATVSSIYSFRTSFIDWINTYIAADLFIKPASCTSNFCFFALPDEVVRAVERLPGIGSVNRYRALPLEFRGQRIVAGFGSAALSWKYRPGISPKEKELLERLTKYPEIIISDYLKVRFRLKQGDVVMIPTPKGNVAFTVDDTALSFSTLSGFLYTDRRWLKEYWGLNDATQLSVYVKKGVKPGEVIEAIEKELGSKYALDITDNADLRRDALAVFDKSFALTYAIELIAIVISLIGVVNALLILVFERKREISVLRYLGASWQQVRKVMVLSAGIVGLAGICLGAVMGAAIGLVITRVINKISFGWEVGLSFPVPLLLALMALLFATTLLAGLVPSYLARKIDPRAFISFE